MKREIKADKREKTLLVAVLLSMWGPLVTGYALTQTDAITQLADFIRRSVELLALIAAYFSYRAIEINNPSAKNKQTIERVVQWFVVVVLIISGLTLLSLAYQKVQTLSTTVGSLWIGLTVAILGTFVNGFLWMRYARYHKELPSAIIGSQKVLYRAKTMMDFMLVITFTSLSILTVSRFTHWMDIIGTMLVAIYLIYTALWSLKHNH